MANILANVSQSWKAFSRWMGLFFSPVVAVSMIGRAGLFVFNFHRTHNIILESWALLQYLLLASVLGTFIGLPFSLDSLLKAIKAKRGLAEAQVNLAICCLLIPLGLFLLFNFPSFFNCHVDLD